MIEAEALSLISNVGFPIFMVLWFMYRTEKVINKNTDAISKLSDHILLNKKYPKE